MRFPVIILLTVLNPALHAAEKIPLTEFLNGIRHQLYSIDNPGIDSSSSMIIKNVHIDMQVIAEKDEDGNTAYYVLEGMADDNKFVTQTLSLDLELQHHASMMSNHSKRRTYSTRTKDDTYRPDAYQQPAQYPCPPAPYMPDIYPLIMLDKQP